ncbi:MAG: rRNA maturation RNase YbeY [Candidatus Magasanikbacteria bacterium]
MPCNVFSSVKRPGLPPKRVRSIVDSVFSGERKRQYEISIHFVGDMKIRSLNRVYRGKDAVTDVLSFGTENGLYGDDRNNDFGDIFICTPQILRQAKECGVPFGEECARMIIHGILHILGYDHKKSIGAKKMFFKQERLVEKNL